MKVPSLPKMPMPDVKKMPLRLGEYDIWPATDGGFWIYHESGEGMHLKPGVMEKLIGDFYKENF